MTHVTAFGASAYKAFQFPGNGLRVIFERRTHCPAGERNASEQNTRGNQIIDQCILRRIQPLLSRVTLKKSKSSVTSRVHSSRCYRARPALRACTASAADKWREE
jgi:hypothetical protein